MVRSILCMSHSKYRPIPMTTRQVLQSYAFLRTACFDARCMVNLNGFAVSTQDAIITVLIAHFCITSVVMSDHPSVKHIKMTD